MAVDESRAAKVLRFEALKASLAVSAPESQPSVECLPTGVEQIDCVSGGLHKGVINEFCGSSGSGPLLLESLLVAGHEGGWHLAYVDGRGTFDPGEYEGSLLRGMLWVRCENSRQAVRSADLLLRDGNLPLVILDLQDMSDAALRKIPASTWHRFSRLLENTGITFLVVSRYPVSEGARLRIHCESTWQLESLDRPRNDLRSTMHLLVKQRAGLERRRQA